MDKNHQILFWLGKNLFVIILYSITAYLGLFLAIYPGYATPIWPPSGIALGAVLVWGLGVLPGIFIGSFIINSYLTLHGFNLLSTFLPFVVGIGIALGAVLQALFGYYLIRNRISFNQFDRTKEILLFALLAGPISCLINTTWSNLFLLLMGFLSVKTFFYNWITWWVGDSIGVLIFAPIFLILFAQPKTIWRKRFFPILFPLIISFVLVILAHFFSNFKWSILFGQLLFCVIVVIFSFILYGQKNLVQVQVDEKTISLKEEKSRYISLLKKRRKAELAAERMAHTDELTGLPNRKSFLEVLPKAISHAKYKHSLLAICFIDIDNFKQINDSFGHHVGDELLKIIGDLIKSMLKSNDFIARLGGDELGLIIEDVSSIKELKDLLNKIIKSVDVPVSIKQYEITKSVSVGVALYPNGGQNADELLMHADIAMYRAKDAGKNTFKFYNQHIHQILERKHQVDLCLRNAIASNELFLKYQPQIDIRTNQLTGMEAWVYWHNEELGGLVNPTEFIPIAENNGLIISIGEWVMKHACKDFILFRSQFESKHFFLSVNISTKQLEDDRFFIFVTDLFNELKLDKSLLSLEINESSLAKSYKKSIQTLRDFARIGFQITLDDFGTGYSSIEYLKTLPISVLKIDKSFIQNISKDVRDETIIKSTIQLTRALGILPVAEGVETAEQLNFLKINGCEEAQGFYFAKPMLINDFIEFCKKFATDS